MVVGIVVRRANGVAPASYVCIGSGCCGGCCIDGYPCWNGWPGKLCCEKCLYAADWSTEPSILLTRLLL